MNIKIDKANGVPLYIQIKNQISDLIKNSIIKVGDKVPTERELAKQLNISRNTISTAYYQLEQEGVLKSYQGKGTFVVGETVPWKDQDIKKRIVKFIDLGLEEALEAGMDVDSYLEIIVNRVKEQKKLMNKIVAAYVECNIEQSVMFSKELEKITNMQIIPFTISDLKSKDDKIIHEISKCQVIISTFNHVNEVTTLTSAFNKKVFGVGINPDLATIVKVARYPSDTRFGFICITNEFMFKIKGALDDSGLENLKIIYSNTKNKKELNKIINKSDVIIVSPGRYKEVQQLNSNNKDVIQFLFNIDSDSVKALKSKIVELKYLNSL